MWVLSLESKSDGVVDDDDTGDNAMIDVTVYII